MADQSAGAARGRGAFVPVMLVGLAGAGGAAVGTTRGWIDFGDGPGAAIADVAQVPDRAPVAAALALVVLAGFGTLLVTRGGARRALAWVTLIAAVACVAALAWSAPRVLADAKTAMDTLTAGHGMDELSLNGWVWVSAVAAIVASAAAVLAVRTVGDWPEMARRYDAPGTSATSGSTAGLAASTNTPEDWWRALDAGEDPTIDRPNGDRST